jgi:hypothetical protein
VAGDSSAAADADADAAAKLQFVAAVLRHVRAAPALARPPQRWAAQQRMRVPDAVAEVRVPAAFAAPLLQPSTAVAAWDFLADAVAVGSGGAAPAARPRWAPSRERAPPLPLVYLSGGEAGDGLPSAASSGSAPPPAQLSAAAAAHLARLRKLERVPWRPTSAGSLRSLLPSRTEPQRDGKEEVEVEKEEFAEAEDGGADDNLDGLLDGGGGSDGGGDGGGDDAEYDAAVWRAQQRRQLAAGDAGTGTAAFISQMRARACETSLLLDSIALSR